MSEWQYTPIENIAFALEQISQTLERIEKLMPIPHGEITQSNIWVSRDGSLADKNNYKVELTLKRRVVVQVKAINQDEAILLAQDIHNSGDARLYDEFILGPDAVVEELPNDL